MYLHLNIIIIIQSSIYYMNQELTGHRELFKIAKFYVDQAEYVTAI